MIPPASLAPGCHHRAGEALRFGANYTLSEGGHAVVAPAFVIERGVGAFVGFLHQSRREHALQAAIERAGTELQCIVGLPRDVLHDAVAVPFLVGEGQQDMEDRRGKRKQFVGRWRLWP